MSRAPVEPSEDTRIAVAGVILGSSNDLRQKFAALTAEGFSEQQALAMLALDKP